MIDEILGLEKQSAHLEPDHLDRNTYWKAIMSYSEEFLNDLPELKAYVSEMAGEDLHSVVDRQEMIEDCLTYIKDKIDKPGINPASQGHLGYIPGGGAEG